MRTTTTLLALALVAALAGCQNASPARSAVATAGAASAKGLFHRAPAGHEIPEAYKKADFDTLLGLATREAFAWDGDPQLIAAMHRRGAPPMGTMNMFMFEAGFDGLGVAFGGGDVQFKQQRKTWKQLVFVRDLQERRLITSAEAVRAARSTGVITHENPEYLLMKTPRHATPVFVVQDTLSHSGAKAIINAYTGGALFTAGPGATVPAPAPAPAEDVAGAQAEAMEVLGL